MRDGGMGVVDEDGDVLYGMSICWEMMGVTLTLRDDRR